MPETPIAPPVARTPLHDALDQLEADIPDVGRGYATVTLGGGSTQGLRTEARIAGRLGQTRGLTWTTGAWGSVDWGTHQYSYGARLRTTW